MTVTAVLVLAAPNPTSATAQLGEALLGHVTAALQGRGAQVDARTVRVASHAQDLARVQVGGLASPALARDLRLVERAGAVITVTQVFQGSYSGLFKAFWDAVDPDAMAGTPVLLAACGASPAHTMVVDQLMRPLFGFLRALVVPTAVYLATRDTAAGAPERLEERMRAAAAELASMV